MRIPMDLFTPTKRRRDAEPQREERKPAPQSSQLSIPSTESQGNTWKPIIGEAMGQTLEQWFRHCKEQHLEIGGDARRFVEEQNYRSCLSVVNSPYPQNYPGRKEAAHMFAQSEKSLSSDSVLLLESILRDAQATHLLIQILPSLESIRRDLQPRPGVLLVVCLRGCLSVFVGVCASLLLFVGLSLIVCF